MSKITKALEKAARERLQRVQEHATVSVKQPELALASIRETAAAESSPVASGSIRIDPHIVSAVDPGSPIGEQYRILRTNLQSLRLRSGAKVIAVTSAVHEEGKSVTSINLALALARQEQARVALVDADLRKGTIHTWLGLGERTDGLSTVLANGGAVNGSLVKLESPPLHILPAGPIPEAPAELLESSAMKRLLSVLRTQYDYVIIDTPPVIPVADLSIVAAQSDGVLFVVRAGKTQRKTVAQAQEMLQRAKVNVLGCVLTHVEYYLPGYYRYYHYYRYGKDGNKQPETGREPQAASSKENLKLVA